ncbi:GNAT family N-acetyltransferase [Limosilactobacillus sp. STM2_1]|uniref:GNAT family N-acetyltransferase n=1 Tax=Limosilactobacillus rudii TaxID=2759755 RepID=A0A7W3YMV3_9LACO|nr:GNAT family N-acetyltransferase [Limosilactobacillus rudii]MBB1079681.1 GNAT family N-acetyltransferase [Limosilactobacillus rudii]MBB1097859.1 GNAT family N-acetyltransferase [Limosilactobacillus rudii]MCD7134940.1 GNAT family N-acetyltransferase [Limosilactobacillus rudii]
MDEINITKATETKLEGLAELLTDDKLVQSVGLMLPRDKKSLLQALHLFVLHNHVALLEINSKVVGMIVLSNWYDSEGQRIAHQYELGYLLKRDFWGRRIMTATLNKVIAQLPVGTIIHARCKKENHRSQQVLINCGFGYKQNSWWQLTK